MKQRVAIRRSSPAIVIAALASIAATHTEGAAQIDTVRIPSETRCASCSVELHKLVTIGSPADSSSVTWNSTLVRNSVGDFYVAPMAHGGEVYIFDSRGAFKRHIGRLGRGPGEFSRLLILGIDDRDTLHVIDNGNRRHTVIDPHHEVIRTAPLQAYARAFVLADGRLIVQSDIHSPDCFGLPLQLLSPEGSIRRCYGGAPGVIRRDLPHERMRMLAATKDGDVWSSRVNRYEMQLLDSAGGVRRHVVRETEWFRGWLQEPTDAYVRQPPPPRVAGIAATDEGYLQVFVMVPDATWMPPSESVTELRVTVEGQNRQFDTVLEVLDPWSGRLIAGLRVDQVLRPASNGRLAFDVRQNESGDAIMNVWTVAVQGEEPPQSSREAP